jgi:hypothetical protein
VSVLVQDDVLHETVELGSELQVERAVPDAIVATAGAFEMVLQALEMGGVGRPERLFDKGQTPSRF